MRPIAGLVVIVLAAVSCTAASPRAPAVAAAGSSGAAGGGMSAQAAGTRAGTGGAIAHAGAGGAVEVHDAGATPNDAEVTHDAAVDAGAGADASDDAASGAADAALPGPETIPDCTANGIDFTTAPPGLSGDVEIDFSSWLQPVGVRERAYVAVLDDQGGVDATYNGMLHWTLPQGAELIDSPPLVAGETYVTFRFHDAGTWQLSATLDDDARHGASGVIVYNTQLPVWELQVDEADFERITADPTSDELIAGMLSIDGTVHPTMLRLHGASSRSFPKKSLRFELGDSGPVSGTYGKKLILRAEYNDKTLLRNWLALRMLYAGTHVPTPRSKLVHFRVNDRYYGVMHNVERIDARLLDRWSLPRTGSMYEADPIDSLAVPGANLTPLSPEVYPSVYQHQSGTIDYTDLRTLIEQTLTQSDADLAQTIEHEIVMDDYLSYLALMAAIQNIDHVRKNYYLYRDPAGSLGWQTLPWDLDLSFGHLWTEENDVLDESISTDVDIFMGLKVQGREDFYNQLITRVFGFPTYRSRFRTRLGELLSGPVTRAQAEVMLDKIIRCATPDIAGDTQKRAENSEYLERVAEIGAFLDARAAYVQTLPP